MRGLQLRLFTVISLSFYTALPSGNAKQLPRTFIILPPEDSKSISHFTPAANTLAPNELQAHTGMFSAKTNDGYYSLGLETSKIIREAINIGRGLVQDDDATAAMEATAEEAMGEKLETDGPTESKESEEAKEWMEKGAKSMDDPLDQKESEEEVDNKPEGGTTTPPTGG